jgi:ABC-2 type transport system ATP-binding protein
MWKNNNYWYDLGLLKPSKGRVLIDNQDIEKNRINVLKKINFISPYIELPKKTYSKTKFVYLWKTIWC